MARTQRSIEERISEKEIQYEQVMEKAKQYQAQMKRLKQQNTVSSFICWELQRQKCFCNSLFSLERRAHL